MSLICNSISSTFGNCDFKYSGISSSSLYSLTPIGLLIFLNAYSAVKLSLFLHNNNHMVALSVLSFTKSSIADK